jgi:putative Ca2+/H+ antiporter (TMEM165/GDT1 family)
VDLLLEFIHAFLIVDGITIATGSWVTSISPIRIVKIIYGIMFIVFGLVILIRKEKEFKPKKFYNNAFISGFVLILFAEEDKTQIASALFGTKYNAVMMLSGTMIALTLISIMAVYFGKVIAERINKKMLTRFAAVIFIIMCVVFFF